MSHDRHIRHIPLILLAVAATVRGANVAELSAVGRSVRIDVSDDAPAVVEIAGDAIVPIRWTRGGRTRATLPIVLLPGARVPSIDLVVAGEARSVALEGSADRITIDPALYAAAWRRADSGRWTALAATAALTLLLASRVRPERRGAIVVGVVATAWTAGLLAVAAARPDLERSSAGDVTWLRARRAAVARVAIAEGEVPVVESSPHLRSLAPRIDVNPDGHAMLELTLTKGARVALVRPAR